jgi:hypothetical protein
MQSGLPALIAALMYVKLEAGCRGAQASIAWLLKPKSLTSCHCQI